MENDEKVSLLENERCLALYYANLRDKIGALNVAILGFVLAIFETAQKHETLFFALLLVIGFFSFASCLRAGIAYNFHFLNYDALARQVDGIPAIFDQNRTKYWDQKFNTSMWSFCLTAIPTHIYWAILIGGVCPIFALTTLFPA